MERKISMTRFTALIAAFVTAVLIGACTASHAAPLTKRDVLTLRDGRFYLHGKRFAEISFNKFDLFWEPFDLLKNGKGDTQEYRDMVAAQDHALRELHEMGFRSIRIFGAPWGIWDLRATFDDPAKRESVYFKAMDTVLDLCDKNDIRVVYSLGCANFTDRALVHGKWVYGEEHERELIANPASRSRQELYRYIDIVVNRYKSRQTILMWEISNETTLSADISPETNIYNGERMPALLDVAHFFNDVATRIKANDPLRLVNSGGSCMRGCQWNQYTNHKWILDTVEEQNKALSLVYSGSAVDVLDIHYYTNNHCVNEMVEGADGKKVPMDIGQYMAAAKRIGKPLMIGETGSSETARDDNPKNKQVYAETPDYHDSYWDPNAAKWVKILCDQIVDAGPQLTYWWEYSSNRPVDQKAPSFDIKKGRTDPVLAEIIDANKRLKAKLGAQ
ncbi:MAG: cellulase family glycosylhydrolase [Capsulimonadaceae bacterium]|nr:cellulase family glycosylhydrolase [Capsulimonadaceae bacterium]